MRFPEDRERLASTFGVAADRYQRARAEYPVALYEQLLGVTQLRPPSRLLEIGCATGKAMLPLAERGFRITALEPGPVLAAAARGNLTDFDVEVVEARFEDWVPALESGHPEVAATGW